MNCAGLLTDSDGPRTGANVRCGARPARSAVVVARLLSSWSFTAIEMGLWGGTKGLGLGTYVPWRNRMRMPTEGVQESSR